MLVSRAVAMCVLIFMAPKTVDTQNAQVHRSRWWLQMEVQRDLGLSATQVDRLNQAFERTLSQRIALRRTLDRLDAALQRMIEHGDADETTVSQLSGRVERIRAQRNVARTLMLFSMYQVLTPTQRVRLSEIQKRYAPSPGH